MKKIKVFFSILMLILMTAYLFLSPKYIKEAIVKGRVPHWQNKPEAFNGIIELWHIVGFKAHTGSVSNWLKLRTAEFEKKHFGVFINVTAMTLEEYNDKRAKGQKADIYSIPLGLEYSDLYMPLNTEQLLDSVNQIKKDLLQTGCNGNDLYALPYMYSGYCFIVNNSKSADISGQKLPLSGETISELVNSFTSASPVICGNKIVAANERIIADVSDYDAFKNGNAPFAINDFRAVGDIERRQGSKSAFSISSYAFTNYTDLVQYIALDKDLIPEKQGYAYEFINGLYSEKAQGTLSELNAYPAIDFDNLKELLSKYGSIAHEAFSIYCKPTVPNCFLYKRCIDSLYADASLALSNDSSALIRFSKRMTELLKTS